uniref:ATP synthase complex subunit 8 n=1 Tax=Prostomis sp. PRO01 TaxID=1205644 RepID=A0A0S2MQ19_9CUCU|nr:ATP synthase F0 subunit 8 [Prostomis sp. PRO01]
MPQMSPMNWTYLMLMFIITFLMFIFINYYLFVIKNKFIKKPFNVLKLNWKW